MSSCFREPYYLAGRLQNPYYIINPSVAHTHTIIMLHDVASNGTMFGRDLMRLSVASTGRTLDRLYPSLRICMWFDMARLIDPSFRQDLQREGLRNSARQIASLIDLEKRRVPVGNIVIGGLGQGCAMAIVVLLGLGHRLGGLIGISGYLPFWFELEMVTAQDSSDEFEDDDDSFYEEEQDDDALSRDQGNDATPLEPCVKAQLFVRRLLDVGIPESPSRDQTSVDTPIFLAHDDNRGMVSNRHGQHAALALEMAEYDVEFKTYWQPAGQPVPDELDDIVMFVRRNLGLTPRNYNHT
ncbi:hypothetical protein CDD80_1950 [Ophiocordyceps camponoti-rufipedis]|uniref:Phospholipase/carboxylesterase/thioesterase domain-containing protein n=1 Tax=Ophiocordyceps camponoti-rufipedis TaxID=2004952 RepID=A0A2C5Z254_9HYPO|nr:hypothetical protein CDD80_1950 [Ophiocordyceps camponoti-rufipedis]